jgi:thymidylate synthase (FAD)
MNLKDKYFPILKHGFVSLIDHMGNDQDIERAARLSYNKFDEVREIADTRKLLRFLMRKRHTSPFEQVVFKFHVRLPIFVMRQWVRHRTASLNEISYRYTEALDLYETIDPDKWRTQSKDNKQGSGICLLEEQGCELSSSQDRLQDLMNLNYQRRLDAGVSREQARIDLPLSIYTEMVWTMDLHNLLHFLDLRCQPDAQQEIRQYANVIAGIVKKCCPITFEAWEDYVFEAVTFSKQEMCLLYFMIHYRTSLEGAMTFSKDILENNTLSKREVEEFKCKINNYPTNFDYILPDAKPYSYFQENHHEENNQMEQSTS